MSVVLSELVVVEIVENNWRLNTWPVSPNCKLKIKHKKERLEYVR